MDSTKEWHNMKEWHERSAVEAELASVTAERDRLRERIAERTRMDQATMDRPETENAKLRATLRDLADVVREVFPNSVAVKVADACLAAPAHQWEAVPTKAGDHLTQCSRCGADPLRDKNTPCPRPERPCP